MGNSGGLDQASLAATKAESISLVHIKGRCGPPPVTVVRGANQAGPRHEPKIKVHQAQKPLELLEFGRRWEISNSSDMVSNRYQASWQQVVA
jgi:hypothetical protein